MHRTFKGQARPILSLLALSSLLWGTSTMLCSPEIWAQTVEDSNPANPSSLWDFNSQTNQLRLTLDPGVAPRYFLLARPMRIAIEFPAPTGISPESFQYSSGAVEQLTVSPQGNGNLRIILQLRSGVELQPKQVSLQQVDSRRWLITPLLVGSAAASSAPVGPALPSISVGANSIFDPPTTGLSPERSIPDLAPVTPQPLTLRPPASLPTPLPTTGATTPEPYPMDHSWPTQIVELRPPASSTPTPAPIERSVPSSQPAPPVSTPFAIPVSIPVPQAIVPEPIAQTTQTQTTQTQTTQTQTTQTQTIQTQATQTQTTQAQATEPEKPAPLATRPLVETVAEPVKPLGTIAPSQNVSLSRSAPQSLARPAQTTTPAAEATRPPVTLVPVPSPTAIEPASRPTTSRPVDRSSAQSFNPQTFTPQTNPQPITQLEFGQPLPISTGSANRATNTAAAQSKSQPSEIPELTLPLAATTLPGSVAQSPSVPVSPAQMAPGNRTILLAKGSPIPLRYTGTVPLKISASENRQEVLVVDEDIKSAQGQVLIPGGSEVIGHFETSWRGSRFIAQAISLGTNNQAFEAQSERLGGDRSPNPLSIGAGSGTGAIAGTLIAGGFGALGGAAIGAVSGYFVSPQAATLEPHQILMVYLAEDWLAN
jgi:hypothetical protein